MPCNYLIRLLSDALVKGRHCGAMLGCFPA